MKPTLLLLFAALSCPPASSAADSLQVVAKAPSGRTQSRGAALVITAAFNQPMVPLGAPADAGKECPLRLEPSVKGRCRWQGTQVLAFEPEKPLDIAAAYRAVIPAGTKSLVSGQALAKDEAWTFETLRPSVVDSRPRGEDKWIDLKAELFVQFNMDMDPRRARGSVVLEETGLDGFGEKLEVPVGVRRARPEEIKAAWPYHYGVSPSSANTLAFKPAALKPDRFYRLRLREGLLAEEGKLGFVAERAIRFETWYSFRALGFPQRGCIPSPLTLSLSNPVRHEELLKHMTVEPSTPMPVLEGHSAEWTGSRDSHHRRVSFEMPEIGYKPDSLYAFRISGRLKDVFGNELGEDVSFPLQTDGYCPRLTMPQGFGILESYLPPRHPVHAVNVQRTPLEKTYIPYDGFIPFFKGEDFNCGKSTIVPAGASRFWDLTVQRNLRLNTFIDLAPALPAGEKGGMVFSQVMNTEGCWLKAVDDVTRLGLTVKDSPDSMLIWVSYLRTAAPARGVPVEIRDDDNKVLWRGTSDPQGFAQAPGWKGLGIKDWKRWERPKLWVLAKDQGGTAVLYTDWRGGVSPWRFDVPMDTSPRPERYEGSLFSERGVYRPGETVRLKGLLRKLEAGDWSLLRGKDDPQVLSLTVQDSRGADVVKTTVSLSDLSSFDHSVDLREGAPTGMWSVSVTEPQDERGETVRPVEGEEEGEGREYEGRETRVRLGLGFRVEAFKPASFEVKAVPERQSYLAHDTYTAVVDGWYLFGAPMPEAPVDWTLRLEPRSYAPPGWEGFDFSPGWWSREENTGRVAGAASGRLDDKGKISVTAQLDPGSANGPLAAVLEAGVSSPERQRLFGRVTAMVHRADLYFGIRPQQSFVLKGKDFQADLIAVRPDGTPVPGLDAWVKVVRRDWLSVQRAGVGGRLEWVTEQRDTAISTTPWRSEVSTSTWKFAPDKPGYYFLRVSGKDEKGRPAESAVSFYVVGSGEAWWARQDNDVIELVADKKSYKPGDTARILVKSPYPKTRALVTLEREGIMSKWLKDLEGGAGFIEVPIKDSMVPNVFVGVMLVQGRAATPAYAEDGDDLAKPQVKFGYAQLSVDPGGRRLSVKVESDKKEYRPRMPVTVSLSASDESGRPAAGAELTVFAVDEGVLALTGYATPDVFEDFYRPRPLLTTTVDSRLYVIGQRSFGEKGENRGGGGGAGLSLEGIDLRSRFIPTAYWNPSVRTGQDGKAQVAFVLPDNLSRFRIMAVAHSGRRFGSGDSRFTVTKSLLLRPSLPRLSRTRDVFSGGAVVHNYSASAATAAVQLSLDGDAVSVEGDMRREVFVGPGKAVETLWNCRTLKPGKTSFQFRAKAGAEVDGLEWTVPVRASERLETVATTGIAADSAVEELVLPIGEAGGVKAGLSPTALAGLQEGAKFLLEYPYGCLEQRLSRMLPVITGAELTSAFGLGTMGGLKAEVQKELDRLRDFQHPSGGFGYWPNPFQPDPYVTSYALEVAALAGKEGYSPPTEVVGKAVAWLKTTLSLDQQWAYPYDVSEVHASRAYAIYSLALHGDLQPGHFQKLYTQRDQLPFLAKAYLLKAAALVSSDLGLRQILAAEMLNQSRVAPQTLHFEEPDETRMRWVHGSTVKATALSLQALLEAQAGFAGDEKAVTWLVGERKGKGRWRTTQENAASLRALQDFYRRYEKETPDFTAVVSREGGPTLWTERFSGRALQARIKDLPLLDVFGPDSRGKLRFAKSGTGRLYYTLSMGYTPPGYKEKAWEGLEIEKTIKPLYGKGKTLKAGSRAVVTLTVTTKQDRTFVAVEDPLPAGFEIVDPTFAVEGKEDARAMAEQTERGQYWGTFQRNENYDDRIQIFADLLTKGVHKYSYLVQATTPGVFHSPATWAEQMYEPEVFGRTPSSSVTVER